MANLSSENEIIAVLLNAMYNGGQYKEIYVESVLKSLGAYTNDRDLQIITNQLEETGFAIRKTSTDRDFFGYPTGYTELTDIGILMFREHGDFLSFLNRKSEQERAELIDEKRKKRGKLVESFPKRYWYIVAIIAYLGGIASPLIIEYGKKIIWQKSDQIPPDLRQGKDTSVKSHAEPQSPKRVL
jgi:hypothetical protein